MILRIILGMVILIGALAPFATAATQPTEEQKAVVTDKINAAVEAAQNWLAIVDNGRYEESWDKAAQFFKDKVPQGQWETSLRQVRSPLGKASSREIANVQYATSMPGAPAGEYVVIQFKTKFEQKPDSIETITPMLGADGQWYVSGYYIK